MFCVDRNRLRCSSFLFCRCCGEGYTGIFCIVGYIRVELKYRGRKDVRLELPVVSLFKFSTVESVEASVEL